MQVRLEVAQKNAKVKKVVLKSDAVIGRSTQCNLRIASSDVSRQHCKLTLIESGVLVRDLQSSNGTYVDGKPVPPNQDVALTPGCELAIGPVKFIVHFDATRPGFPQPGSTVDLPAVAASAQAAAAVLKTPDSVIEPPSAAEPDQAASNAASDAIGEDDEDAPTVMVERDAFAEATQQAIAEEFPEDSASEGAPQAEADAVAATESDPDGDDAALADIEAAEEEEWTGFSFEDAEDPAEPEMPVFVVDSADADDETVSHAQDVVEPEEMEAPEEPETEEPPRKAGGLKSLFGLFGRKKKSADEPAPQPADEDEVDLQDSAADAAAQADDVELEDAAYEVEYEEQTEDAAPAVAEVSEDDVAGFLSGMGEDAAPEDEDADESLKNFFNQLGND